MAATFFAIATMLLVGRPVAHAIGAHRRPVAMIALSFLYGSGIVFLVMQTMSMIGIVWSITPVLMCCAVIAALATFIERPQSPPNAPIRWHPIDLATLLLVSVYGYLAIVRPRRVGDFYGIWGLKGQLFTTNGGINWDLLAKPWLTFAHADYPVLIPIDYAFAGLLNGGWTDRWVGAFTFAWFLAIVVIFRELAGEETSPAIAATIAFVAGALAMFPVGGADIPLAAFGGAALLLLRRGDTVSVRHAAILLGLATMTKNEGLTLLVAAVAGLVVAGRFRDVLRLWPAPLIAAPWLIVRSMRGLENDLTQGSPVARLADQLREPGTLFGLLWEYLDPQWVCVAVAIAFLIGFRRERFIVTALFVQFLIFAAAYGSTPHALRWHIANSWDRLVLQIIVPAAYPALIILWRWGAGLRPAGPQASGLRE